MGYRTTDEYIGTIHDIRDGKAYVTIESEDGARYTASRNADIFSEKGINVGERFLIRVLKDPVLCTTEIEIEPLPVIELTDEDITKIYEEIKQVFGEEE